ncbi:MAG: threonine--tRNA ligase [Candidatus Aenigmatarchaeota archaeon]
MRILQNHSDFIEYTPIKKEIKAAEEAEKKTVKYENIVVLFTAVEKGDNVSIAKNAIDEVKKSLEVIKCNKILIYPFVHLSNTPAGVGTALKVLNEMENYAKEIKLETYRAPFGWTKQYNIKIKGHPLAEQSKVVTTGEKEVKKTREDVVKDIKKGHFILTPEGKEYKIDLKDEKKLKKILKEVKNDALSKYIFSEEIKGVEGAEPPSIKEMQQQELVGYAPESDIGNFKLYPKGLLFFELLVDWAYEIAVNRFGCIQIDTPILYDWNDSEIREQGGSFHERHYTVSCPDEPNKEMVLRFAGDFGLFKMLKKATFSYKQLPLRMYEFSKSFRCEKSGELSGLRRLRAFHMPDIHCFCYDLDAGWDEYQELYKQYDDLAKGTKIEFAIIFRVVDSFYEKYKEKFIEMLKYSKLPAFIETISDMKHYWAVKHEFQGIDSVGGNCQLSTVQLDVKDSEVYDITYVDKDGKEKGCVICHSSIGSIERWMFSILEDALKKKTPSYPLWLSPTHVRLCPINDTFVEYCESIADNLEKNNIRVDIDDNAESIQKKVRNAEMEWVPYIVVVGQKEKDSGNLAVRLRETGKVSNMTPEDLTKEIKDNTKNYPFRKLSLNRLLTKRPTFV